MIRIVPVGGDKAGDNPPPPVTRADLDKDFLKDFSDVVGTICYLEKDLITLCV